MKYTFRYYITNKCNFSCDYCFRKFRVGVSNYEPSMKDIDNMVINLNGITIQKLTILGGEPSLSDNTLYLIDSLIKQTEKVQIITNGTNLSFFNELEPYKNNCKEVALQYSYHPQYDNTKNVDKLMTMFPASKINVMLYEKYIDNIIQFIDRYKEHHLDLYVITNEKYVKTPVHLFVDLYKMYKFNFSRYYKHNIVNYTNKLCYNNVFFVESDGNIIEDSCHLGTVKCNLYTESFLSKYKKYSIQCSNTYKLCNMCDLHYHGEGDD